jgi:hypothetical protein
LTSKRALAGGVSAVSSLEPDSFDAMERNMRSINRVAQSRTSQPSMVIVDGRASQSSC